MGTINRSANFSRSAHERRLNVRTAKARVLPMGGPRGPGVAPEERRRLAECCAFFKAEKYREAGPGKVRENDVSKAEAEIDAVIENLGKRSGSA
jgi:hypothetical protein